MPLVDEMRYVEVWCTYAEMEVDWLIIGVLGRVNFKVNLRPMDMSKPGAVILNQWVGD